MNHRPRSSVVDSCSSSRLDPGARLSDLFYPIPDMDADAPNVFVLQATAMHDYISGSLEGVEYVVDPWDRQHIRLESRPILFDHGPQIAEISIFDWITTPGRVPPILGL